jgi:hypothetical protein
MMRVEVHILGATVVVTARPDGWRRRRLNAAFEYRKGGVRAMDQPGADGRFAEYWTGTSID